MSRPLHVLFVEDECGVTTNRWKETFLAVLVFWMPSEKMNSGLDVSLLAVAIIQDISAFPGRHVFESSHHVSLIVHFALTKVHL